MGNILNPSNDKFVIALNGQIYVDKTGLLKYTNSVVRTPQRFVCISRPRRFGKSMAADMLVAYYSRGCESKALFENLTIGCDDSFDKYRNQFDVIFLNMQEYLSRSKNIREMLEVLEKLTLRDLKKEYPDADYFDDTNLVQSMIDVYEYSERPFVVIIDEWDCVFREYKQNKEAQEQYLDFLRSLLKDKGYIHLAYMTGILPIKKYGTHSALNMFDEFSMTYAGPVAEYVGFTETEVAELCNHYDMNMDEMKKWYDGYNLKNTGAVYSPRSVVSAMQFGHFENYWNQTETFEALRMYIDLNFDGLKDDILTMMAGGQVTVNTGSFTNDMTTFATKDDVLTLLIHLGYLAYDSETKKINIPNYEILNEYANAVRASDWGEVSKALELSNDTLNAIWNQDEKLVADHIAKSHVETSHLQYNDENALSYTISLALYSARNYYTIYRELPTGKGFADMVFVPRKKSSEKPALLVELKWDKTALGAIEQIKEKNYSSALEEYKDNLLLVAINYDKKSKEHECIIKKY